MPDATFTEFRNHAKVWFDRVEAGQTVRILRRGKPIAELHPITPQPASWQRAARPLTVRGKEISQLIMEERDA